MCIQPKLQFCFTLVCGFCGFCGFVLLIMHSLWLSAFIITDRQKTLQSATRMTNVSADVSFSKNVTWGSNISDKVTGDGSIVCKTRNRWKEGGGEMDHYVY